MEVIIQADYDAVSRVAADLVEELVRKKPDCVLGLATGGTPVGLYQELIRRHQEEKLSFSKVTSFNLDEYYGLTPDHPQSYHYFMNEELFDHINIPKKNRHVPDGMAKNVEKWCKSYENKIKRAGGIDLQVLGIGGDGHIAFNEPGSSLVSRTRMKTLTEETIRDNKRFFNKNETVPIHAITMGVGTIMDAKHCIMIATGEKKAKIVAAALEGPVTSQVTASVLQMHPKTTVIIDEAAAKKLKNHKYYRWCYDRKPTG